MPIFWVYIWYIYTYIHTNWLFLTSVYHTLIKRFFFNQYPKCWYVSLISAWFVSFSFLIYSFFIVASVWWLWSEKTGRLRVWTAQDSHSHLPSGLSCPTQHDAGRHQRHRHVCPHPFPSGLWDLQPHLLVHLPQQGHLGKAQVCALITSRTAHYSF